MISDLAVKHAGNILKLGSLVLASTLLNSSVRVSSNSTMEEIVKDVKKTRREYNERKSNLAGGDQ